jgi:hypothetical protein
MRRLWERERPVAYLFPLTAAGPEDVEIVDFHRQPRAGAADDQIEDHLIDDLESCLCEMLISGQHVRYPKLLHDHETGAVGERVSVIGMPPIEDLGCLETEAAYPLHANCSAALN